MPPKNPYDVLQVKTTATEEEIRQAFRRLAQRYHPDRNPNDPRAAALFVELSEAYKLLADPVKRRETDGFLRSFWRQIIARRGAQAGGGEQEVPRAAAATATAPSPRHATPRPNGHGHGNGHSHGHAHGHAHAPSNGTTATESVTGRAEPTGVRAPLGPGYVPPRRPTPPAERGDDVRAIARVPFEAAALGGQRELEIESSRPCAACEGTGAEAGSSRLTCPDCLGSGSRRDLLDSASALVCPRCLGRGFLPTIPCGECRGAGTARTRVRRVAPIPPCMEDGCVVRLPGEGEPGKHGGPAGDLIVELLAEPHAEWRRRGRDVLAKAKVNLAQAMLGDELEVPTLRGKASTRVPAGTQPGLILRLKGMGAGPADSPGDHLLEIGVELPRLGTKTREKLFFTMAKNLGLLDEMSRPPEDPSPRKAGGGRKKKAEGDAEAEEPAGGVAAGSTNAERADGTLDAFEQMGGAESVAPKSTLKIRRATGAKA